MSTALEIVDECIELEVVDESVATEVVLTETPTEITVAESTTEVVVEEITEVVQDLETIQILEDCKQGPAGPPGSDGAGGVQSDATILQTNTTIVDTVTLAGVMTAKWLVTVRDTVNGLERRSEVVGGNTSTGIKYIHTNRFGDAIDYTVCVDEAGGAMRLVVTNDHTEDIDVSVLRLETVIV